MVASPHAWSACVSPGPAAKGSDKVFTCCLVNATHVCPLPFGAGQGLCIQAPIPAFHENGGSPHPCVFPRPPPREAVTTCVGRWGPLVSGVVTPTRVLDRLQTLMC